MEGGTRTDYTPSHSGTRHSRGKQANGLRVWPSRMWRRGEITMRRVLFWLTLIPSALLAQSPQEPARLAGGEISGRWLVNTDFYGSTIYFRMALKQEGEKFTGNFDGDKLEGTPKSNTIISSLRTRKAGLSMGPWCLPTRTTPRIRRHTSLRRNSSPRGELDRRSAMSLCPQLFTGNFPRRTSRC